MDPRAAAAISGALSEAGPGLAQLSHALWSNPELGLEERAAHDALTAFLESRGFAVERRAVLPTGFVASHAAGPDQPHVALLAEFDALPDVGHACGHNLIAVAAAGAGLAVKAAMEATGLCGRVSVFGTPAEETAGGKVDFIRDGRFRDVDAALMVHPFGGAKNVLLPRVNACVVFEVAFSGRATHAAANPWLGINALDAAVLAYQNVAARRQQFRPLWRAAGIITRGGTAVNVIPDSAEMQFTLRAPNREELDELTAVFQDCMQAAARATGCAVKVEDVGHNTFDVKSNKTLAEAFEKSASSCGVQVEQDCSFGGSTDMGNVSYEVPSIHPLFHIGSAAQIHERDFARAAGSEAAVRFAADQAKALAMTAAEVLRDGALREAMWKEFRAEERL